LAKRGGEGWRNGAWCKCRRRRGAGGGRRRSTVRGIRRATSAAGSLSCRGDGSQRRRPLRAHCVPLPRPRVDLHLSGCAVPERRRSAAPIRICVRHASESEVKAAGPSPPNNRFPASNAISTRQRYEQEFGLIGDGPSRSAGAAARSPGRPSPNRSPFAERPRPLLASHRRPFLGNTPPLADPVSPRPGRNAIAAPPRLNRGEGRNGCCPTAAHRHAARNATNRRGCREVDLRAPGNWHTPAVDRKCASDDAPNPAPAGSPHW